MPIPDFDGDTFVAYTDISGFKAMLKQDQRAISALDHFYTSGFRILRANPNVHGAFISDCAILFANNRADPEAGLLSLLTVVEQLNRKLLEHGVMLTTSIAHGRFSYHQRIEFAGIEKNPVFGNAYVTAFLDNESGQPRMQPGECRIVKQGLNDQQIRGNRLRNCGKHLYFYWMVTDEAEIDVFIQRYTDAYDQKYRGMLMALKDAAEIRRE